MYDDFKPYNNMRMQSDRWEAFVRGGTCPRGAAVRKGRCPGGQMSGHRLLYTLSLSLRIQYAVFFLLVFVSVSCQQLWDACNQANIHSGHDAISTVYTVYSSMCGGCGEGVHAVIRDVDGCKCSTVHNLIASL